MTGENVVTIYFFAISNSGRSDRSRSGLPHCSRDLSSEITLTFKINIMIFLAVKTANVGLMGE